MSHPLARRALIGLAQSPPGDPRDGLPDAVADLVPASVPPARALLLRAGVWAAAAAAGATDPAPLPPLPAPCPAERTEATSPSLTALVRQLLTTGQADLLALACARLAAHGRVLAPSALVLALSQRDGAARAALLPVLGARGRWLAEQRAEWRWAIAAADADAAPEALDALLRAFDDGTPKDRAAALASLRAHDPARAREALQRTFKGDPPAARAVFIEALATGLGPADEAFLEAALGDRAKGVRAAARDVLALLPGGRLAARMAARADSLLVAGERPDPARGGRIARALSIGRRPSPPPLALEIHLPEALPSDWLDDRIELDVPYRGLGQRAWWAVQVLSLVPPARWSTRFLRGPAELLALLPDDEHAPIVAALAAAAARFGARDWARPLKSWLERHEDAPGPSVTDALLPLLPPLDDDALVALLTTPAAERTDYAATLGVAARPWTEEVGRAFLGGLRQHVARVAADPRGAWSPEVVFFEAALLDAAVALPDALIATVGDPHSWGDLPEHTRGRNLTAALDLFARRLHLRHRLLTELPS